MGALEVLTKMATTGKNIEKAMEKVTESLMDGIAKAVEGTGDLAKEGMDSAAKSGAKGMAVLSDKATGMGQNGGKSKSNDMDLEM